MNQKQGVYGETEEEEMITKTTKHQTKTQVVISQTVTTKTEQVVNQTITRSEEEQVMTVNTNDAIENYFQSKLTQVFIQPGDESQWNCVNEMNCNEIKLSKRSIEKILSIGGYEYMSLNDFSKFSIVEINEDSNCVTKTTIQEEYTLQLEKLISMTEYIWITLVRGEKMQTEKEKEKMIRLKLNDVIKISEMSGFQLKKMWPELIQIFVIEVVEIHDVKRGFTKRSHQLKSGSSFNEVIIKHFVKDNFADKIEKQDILNLNLVLSMMKDKMNEMKIQQREKELECLNTQDTNLIKENKNESKTIIEVNQDEDIKDYKREAEVQHDDVKDKIDNEPSSGKIEEHKLMGIKEQIVKDNLRESLTFDRIEVQAPQEDFDVKENDLDVQLEEMEEEKIIEKPKPKSKKLTVNKQRSCKTQEERIKYRFFFDSNGISIGNVWVVGSIPSIGNWDITKAVKLVNAKEKNFYFREMTIDSNDFPFEFKYFVTNPQIENNRNVEANSYWKDKQVTWIGEEFSNIKTHSHLPMSLKYFETHPLQLRLMNFNIRYLNTTDGLNVWSNRKDPIINMIYNNYLDIICLQEITYHQINDVSGDLDCVYHGIGQPRDHTDVAEQCRILYNHQKYHSITWGQFWLNLNPEKPGKSFGNYFDRICTWTILNQYDDTFNTGDTNAPFIVFNTHLDHVSIPSRIKCTEVLMRNINTILAQHTEIDFAILSGCLYCPRDNEVINYITNQGFRLISTGNNYHNFTGNATEQYDYIFIKLTNNKTQKKEMVVQSHEVIIRDSTIDKSKNMYISDHFPTVATLSHQQPNPINHSHPSPNAH